METKKRQKKIKKEADEVSWRKVVVEEEEEESERMKKNDNDERLV